MNRFTRWGAALVLLPIAACANNTPPAPPPAPPAPPPLAANDAAFVTMAAQMNLAEIQDAQLAATNARGPRVKAYAQKALTDHQAAEDQLKQIAATKNVTLPTQPSDMEAQSMQTLQSAKGHAFDVAYIRDEVQGHQMAIQQFQTEAQSGTDPDVKKYASDTLPVLQQHLQAAQALQAHGRARHAARAARHAAAQ